jgi:hypothetical protein
VISVISVPSLVNLASCSPKLIPAGHGVHRPDSPRPLDGGPVQSAPFAVTTSGPSARACP